MKLLRLCGYAIAVWPLAHHALAQELLPPAPPYSISPDASNLDVLWPKQEPKSTDLPSRAALQRLETLCGENNLKDVELYDGSRSISVEFVRRYQAATGQIQWNNDIVTKYGEANAGNVQGARWCSGTLIGEDIFLTAAHCFKRAHLDWILPQTADGSEISPEEVATNMHVNFNYQKESTSKTVRVADQFPIVRLEESDGGGLDYAVVKLGRNKAGELPAAKYGRIAVATASGKEGDRVTIIQHPAALPKMVDSGLDTRFDDIQVFYGDVDSLGGSSGAGVLDVEGRLVAVHTKGGCDIDSGQNLGVNIRAIVKHSSIVGRTEATGAQADVHVQFDFRGWAAGVGRAGSSAPLAGNTNSVVPVGEPRDISAENGSLQHREIESKSSSLEAFQKMPGPDISPPPQAPVNPFPLLD